MKLNGNIRCPKTNCSRPILFTLNTHDAGKVEFSTKCKICKTIVELTFLTKAKEEEVTQPSATPTNPTSPSDVSRIPNAAEGESSTQPQPTESEQPETEGKDSLEDAFADLDV